ncbi:SP_0009 family protein [uncultured Streptococcus sp.]|nr:SP_0009 family protein [uncultured Streptococcus sp.]
MENLIETTEKFLAYSEEKLEELSAKNQKLRQESPSKTDAKT